MGQPLLVLETLVDRGDHAFERRQSHPADDGAVAHYRARYGIRLHVAEADHVFTVGIKQGKAQVSAGQVGT